MRRLSSPRKENIRQLDHAAPIEERPAAREITAPSHLTAEEFDRFRKEIQRFYLAPYLWGGASLLEQIVRVWCAPFTAGGGHQFAAQHPAALSSRRCGKTQGTEICRFALFSL